MNFIFFKKKKTTNNLESGWTFSYLHLLLTPNVVMCFYTKFDIAIINHYLMYTI
jgi:hypothetical protein